MEGDKGLHERKTAVDFLYKTMAERDPSKRRVKIVKNAELLNIIDAGAESDDSDFQLEEEAESEEDDSSSEASSDSESDEEEDELEEEEVEPIKEKSEAQMKENSEKLKKIVAEQMVCSICLSGQANMENEVIECDGCGILVHEGCYGVSDTEVLTPFAQLLLWSHGSVRRVKLA
ncbi:PHD finger protein 14-like [Artemia franciscana]|uniref:PHD finger protein 14-like n=1 Tax=Artemia franciscana TaxID=6661 RepID=UPI0032DBE9AE